MALSIESKIRLKAVVIYIIVAMAVVGAMVYLNNLRTTISYQRLEVENQYTLLSATNDLILAVSDAQSYAGLYLSTRSRSYLNEYDNSINSIEELTRTLLLHKPNEEDKLFRIVDLMREQSLNIKKLNLQFAEPNPMELINERLREYRPYIREDTVYTTSVRRDTLISEVMQKGFLKRLGAVFRPGRDSVTIVVNQWNDTIRTIRVDSIPFIREVEQMAERARAAYERNMKIIEKQVGELMASNQDIATEVFAMLLAFHKETLHATLSVIDSSDLTLQNNYRYSTLGGIFALIIILIFFILIITDINKGRKARRALEAANERTRQIMESRHQLLLSVSHDIKTPLNSVLAYLSRMNSDPDVLSMQNSSEHILSMLDNLLEFSSLEQGTQQVNLSDFNLKTLFEEIHNMFLPLAAQKSLEYGAGAEDKRIRTDRVKVKQILINLASNAIKYTPSGEVSIGGIFDDNELYFTVTDTGIGILDEQLPQLFKPFSRFKEGSAIAQGAGLGMYVVHGLLELLGGKIEVDSRPGEGTEIAVTIPAEMAPKEIERGVKRVKIYEDNPVEMLMVTDLLLRLGHKVVEQDYNLVITDMEMGDFSGCDVLREVAGAFPVVLMTGRPDLSAHKALALGFDHFLSKPVTIESLREIIGEGEPGNEMLGADRNEIEALFKASTAENFILLKEALTAQNFQQAQALCHKMFPMFAQLGYPTDALRNMDAHREGAYDRWQDDVEAIMAIQL